MSEEGNMGGREGKRKGGLETGKAVQLNRRHVMFILHDTEVHLYIHDIV